MLASHIYLPAVYYIDRSEISDKSNIIQAAKQVKCYVVHSLFRWCKLNACLGLLPYCNISVCTVVHRYKRHFSTAILFAYREASLVSGQAQIILYRNSCTLGAMSAG